MEVVWKRISCFNFLVNPGQWVNVWARWAWYFSYVFLLAHKPNNYNFVFGYGTYYFLCNFLRSKS